MIFLNWNAVSFKNIEKSIFSDMDELSIIIDIDLLENEYKYSNYLLKLKKLEINKKMSLISEEKKLIIGKILKKHNNCYISLIESFISINLK